MTNERTPAELLAALTEEPELPKQASAEATADFSHPGMASLERVIKAYSSLHRHQAAEQDRPVLFNWGHLEVLEKLGSGSYGEVFRAFDKILERVVALKLRTSDETSARAYILEARRLARVRHPHVLAVHGAAVHDGRAGLWADLVEGCTLSEWVRTEGCRSRDEVLAIGIMLGSALEAVHKAGLIHGDVKPGNIMRARHGDVVLMDFGTAIENGTDGVCISAGSPLAMAPEQLKGARVTSAIDVYALGVVLYFLVNGHYPLEADSIHALAKAHSRGSPPDFSKVSRRCGRKFANLLSSMMATDPAHRPDASNALGNMRNIALAPARRRKRIAVTSVVSALALALVVSLVALLRIDAERKSAILANERESAVREFMRAFLASPNPAVGGAEALVVDVLADAVPVAERQFPDEPLILAEVTGDIGFSLAGIGAHAQAIPLLDRSLALGRQYGMSAEKMLPLEIGLASSSAYLQGAKGSAAPIRALFERSRISLGDAHTTTLQAALELGSLLLERSEGDSGEASFRFVLEQRPVPQFSTDSQRLMAQNKLISVLVRQREWEEAETVLQEALSAIRAAGAEGGSYGVVLRMAEANIASRRGRFNEAESLTRALLTEIEKTYGPSHKNVRAALNLLAVSQRMQGKTADAIGSLRRAHELAQAQLSSDHYDVLSIRDNLASALADSGERQEARTLREEVLSSKIRTLGERHPDTLLSAINLAEQYVEDDYATRGGELADKAAMNAEQVFGAEHLFFLEAREISARARLQRGDVEQALVELESIHLAKNRLLGKSDVYTLRSAGFLAAAYYASGDSTSAIALLNPAINLLRSQYGDDQPDLKRMQGQVELAEKRAASPGESRK